MRLLCPGKPRINWAASRARKFQKPNEIIVQKKHSETEDLIPFGFAWRAMSCAFDSVLTPLIHVLKKLNEKQLEAFRGEVSVFDILWKISQSEYVDNGLVWRQCKPELRRVLNDTTQITEVLDIWKALLHENASEKTYHQRFFTFRTNKTRICDNCGNSEPVAQLFSYILVLVPENMKCDSIQHWFNNVFSFNNSANGCRNCKGPAIKVILFDEYPDFLYIEIQSDFKNKLSSFPANGEVDLLLPLDDKKVTYELHAVGYGNRNGGHFQSRFRHANGTNYKYDGMIGCGANAARCFPIDKKEVQFPFYPPEDRSYRIVFAMYIKKTPEQNYN
jgi:hypothetical protein